LLGGMGSKSRKGYGSLALRSLRMDGEERWSPPRDIEEIKASIGGLYREAKPGKHLPPYTAPSEQTRHVLVTSPEANEALRLLDLVGREMIRYRSWGRGGEIFNRQRSEKNFKEDHDLIKDLPSPIRY